MGLHGRQHGLKRGQVRRPCFSLFTVLPLHAGEILRGRRTSWRARQAHPRLIKTLSTLAVIAGPTGTYQVVPDVATAKMAGKHMVQGQFPTSQAAVLAGVVITDEDLATGQPHLRPRSPDQILQLDHTGARKHCARRPDVLHS